MRPLRRSHSDTSERRGAALLLSLLVLLVIILLASQIKLLTARDAQVARNDVRMTQMDLAIESAMLEVHETLIQDAEAGTAEEGGVEGDLPVEGEGEALGGGGSGPVDSKMDQWAQPQATNMEDLSLRILVQDEDSKYNVLNILQEDEEDAEKALERVVRIIDNFREGTTEDIDEGQAEIMAEQMKAHYIDRSDSFLPRSSQLTDDEEDDKFGLPFSLRELVVLDDFEEKMFQDYFDVDGERVHSLDSFLTVWSSPGLGGEEAVTADGGWAVNVNTAPLAVLNGLMDSRDVDTRLWDDILEYRNLEEEFDSSEDETEPMLDEFGNEILQRRFFDDLEELNEVYDFTGMEPGMKAEVEELLRTTSNVFSIYVTARLPTSEEESQLMDFDSRRDQELYERSGQHLVRTVRSIVWRTTIEEEVEVIPLVRWEVMSHAPLTVLDYPDEDY